jgi:hypothetical protein
MDAERFDGIVRALAAHRTRRQALKGLAGAAGVLAMGGRGASAQDCKADGKECKKSSQCCSDNCVGAAGDRRGTCQASEACPLDSTGCCATGRCRDGACVANYATLAECQGRCDCPPVNCGIFGPYAIVTDCDASPVSCPPCLCAVVESSECTNDCAGHGCDSVPEARGDLGIYCVSGGNICTGS